MDRLFTFARSEDAAVTVDWVVLVTAIILLSVGVFLIVTEALYENAAESIGAKILEAQS